MFSPCLTSIHLVTLSLHVIEFNPHVSNLSAEAIEATKPHVDKSKATSLKQEVAQEEGNAPV